MSCSQQECDDDEDPADGADDDFDWDGGEGDDCDDENDGEGEDAQDGGCDEESPGDAVGHGEGEGVLHEAANESAANCDDDLGPDVSLPDAASEVEASRSPPQEETCNSCEPIPITEARMDPPPDTISEAEASKIPSRSNTVEPCIELSDTEDAGPPPPPNRLSALKQQLEKLKPLI